MNDVSSFKSFTHVWYRTACGMVDSLKGWLVVAWYSCRAVLLATILGIVFDNKSQWSVMSEQGGGVQPAFGCLNKPDIHYLNQVRGRLAGSVRSRPLRLCLWALDRRYAQHKLAVDVRAVGNALMSRYLRRVEPLAGDRGLSFESQIDDRHACNLVCLLVELTTIRVDWIYINLQSYSAFDLPCLSTSIWYVVLQPVFRQVANLCLE